MAMAMAMALALAMAMALAMALAMAMAMAMALAMAMAMAMALAMANNPTLTDAQRRYYFGVLIPAVMDYYKNNEGFFVVDVLQTYSACNQKEFIHEMFKKRFNAGKSTMKPKTIAEQEQVMEDYLLRIWQHFDERSYHIPEPRG